MLNTSASLETIVSAVSSQITGLKVDWFDTLILLPRVAKKTVLSCLRSKTTLSVLGNLTL